MLLASGLYIEPINMWCKNFSSEKHDLALRSSLHRGIMITVNCNTSMQQKQVLWGQHDHKNARKYCQGNRKPSHVHNFRKRCTHQAH